MALFGARLATAGIHTNHSLPEPLLSWDFFHLPHGEREGRTLADYRSEAMIRITRVLRPVLPAVHRGVGSTPLRAGVVDGAPALVLTDNDSNRLLTFPNPETLDVPHLYASHADYLRISYDLVRRGVRFGGNNWTPVRARSDVDPVNRILSTTSEQLRELYRKGLYAHDVHATLGDAERALLVDNLCALVDLPMSRVEVRTDEGGDSLDLAIAKVALKELLSLRTYADDSFGAGYAYDEADVARARRNEDAAARRGLGAVVEIRSPARPSGARVARRHARGARAARRRARLRRPPRAARRDGRRRRQPRRRGRAWIRRAWPANDGRTAAGLPMVPATSCASGSTSARERSPRDVEHAAGRARSLGDEAAKLDELLAPLGAPDGDNPLLPVRIAADGEPALVAADGQARCRGDRARRRAGPHPVGHQLRRRAPRRGAALRPVHRRDAAAGGRRGATLRPGALPGGGRRVSPGALLAPVTLGGHFDVVEPDPNDTQFEPRIEGDYLWGRGAADMKTVVASYLVWMRRALAAGPPYPPRTCCWSATRRTASARPTAPRRCWPDLRSHFGWAPELMILGERTGSRGRAPRPGLRRQPRRRAARMVARGEREPRYGVHHPGAGPAPRLVAARGARRRTAAAHLTLESADGVAQPGVVPVPEGGRAGRLQRHAGRRACSASRCGRSPRTTSRASSRRSPRSPPSTALEVVTEVHEGGVACPPDNPHLRPPPRRGPQVAGGEAPVGKKLAGTSARFAPGGNAVVWGQTGIGPHARNERHFIPSIGPYFAVWITSQAWRSWEPGAGAEEHSHDAMCVRPSHLSSF